MDKNTVILNNLLNLLNNYREYQNYLNRKLVEVPTEESVYNFIFKFKHHNLKNIAPIRRKLLMDINIPISYIKEYSNKKEYFKSIVSNRKCPTDILKKIYEQITQKDDFDIIDYRIIKILKNPNISISLKKHIINKNNFIYNSFLLENKNLKSFEIENILKNTNYFDKQVPSYIKRLKEIIKHPNIFEKASNKIIEYLNETQLKFELKKTESNINIKKSLELIEEIFHIQRKNDLKYLNILNHLDTTKDFFNFEKTFGYDIKEYRNREEFIEILLEETYDLSLDEINKIIDLYKNNINDDKINNLLPTYLIYIENKKKDIENLLYKTNTFEINDINIINMLKIKNIELSYIINDINNIEHKKVISFEKNLLDLNEDFSFL